MGVFGRVMPQSNANEAKVLAVAQDLVVQGADPSIPVIAYLTGLTVDQVRRAREALAVDRKWPAYIAKYHVDAWRRRREAVRNRAAEAERREVAKQERRKKYIAWVKRRLDALKAAHDVMGRKLMQDELDALLNHLEAV